MLNRGKCNFLSREKGIELGVQLSLLLSDRGSCRGEESKLSGMRRQPRMASVTAEDRDRYAKPPKINVGDFRIERQMPSPNETQLLATVSN